MTKMGRRLLAVTIIGALLGAAFMLSGCDDEVAADTSAPIVATAQESAAASASNPADVGTSTTPASSEAPSSAAPVTVATAPASGATATAQEAVLVEIEDIIQDPGQFAGMEVIVHGMILTQCMRGCQFSISDDTGVIGIELVDQALEELIEQGSVGRLVVARGILEGETRPRLLVQTPDAWYFDD